ncbi:Vacuolar protein sorting-associated protein 29 [Malassezia yamatoensis]|uniref:Vacuolar protein sorting-associated protein 29 n=1 Tax=Malassezia yamatoensis TaxID=253288 RepID=A0AAJ5YXB5_9BASI|nr:Vacuolar protein sorting-associated protein 29 [Malassezia yamatoensis]
MDVDLLLSGYTHQFEAYTHDGRFFLNPGSATGAWTMEAPAPEPSLEVPVQSKATTDSERASLATKPEAGLQTEKQPEPQNEKPEARPLSEEQLELQSAIPNTNPSFALLDIQGPVVVIYIYQLINDEVKVDKLEYRKPVPNVSEPS